MTINSRLLDQLLTGYNGKKKEELIGGNGLLKQLAKVILEQAIQSEIVYLSDDGKKGITVCEERSRNGKSAGPIVGNFGKGNRSSGSALGNTLPRRVFPDDVNEKIISHHIRGMTPSDIQGHIKSVNGIDVPASMISALTTAVADEMNIWRNRPLENIYPLVYLDVVRVKVRENGTIVDKTVYLMIAVTMEGIKDVLGMWVAENKDAEFWRTMLTELKTRGVDDIFIFCMNDLEGFSEVCGVIFPETEVQLYIGRMVRSCLKYVSWKERKEVIADLKGVYQAVNIEQAGIELAAFAGKWDKTHPSIVQYCRRSWEHFTGLFAYPADIRKVIYTTNTMETLHMALCKVARDRRSFPDNDLMLQLLYLTIQSVTGKWSLPVRDWRAALNRFSLLFSDRMPGY